MHAQTLKQEALESLQRYATPSGVYTAAKGGGAAIPDKFARIAVEPTASKTGNQGQRLSAANEVALS